LFFCTQLFAQYGWNFQYITTSDNHWAHLSSGDTVAIAKFTFSRDNPADPKTYHLKEFNLRPITNSTTGWFIDELRLYLDDGNRQFSSTDSLISGGLGINIPKQSEPTLTISFDFGGDSLMLVDNLILFIVTIVHDWRDDDPGNLEIDTTDSGLYGVWFSIDVQKEDLVVSPTVANDVNDPSINQYSIQALNLPTTVRNAQASSTEDDSIKLNMFYPNYQAINGAASSKNQRLDDLSFYADVYLPCTNDSIELSIKSASFQIGFDNRMLAFESTELGNVWGEDSWFWVSDSVSRVDLYDESNPDYSVIRFDAELNNSRDNYNTYRTIDSSSVVQIKFRVLKPGISPIFFRNIDIRDRWGVQYHGYQYLQNHAVYESGATTDSYDAWVKYILGDFTYSGGAEISTEGICDARVSWEDVSLFANYLWLSSGSANWYKRFDIGSPDSPVPSVLSSDDTTNFYDLMILGINYQRSISGVFNQKKTTRETCQLEIYQENENLSSDLSIIRVFMKNVQDMASTHLCWRFNSTQLQVQSITAGDWVRNTTETQLMLVPDGLLSKGIIDLNFVALSNSLNGEGRFVEIVLWKKTTIDVELFLEEIDVRNSRGEQIEVRCFSGGDDVIVPEEYFLLNNYPNPFNTSTKIAYSIAVGEPGNYTVDIRDILGNTMITLENRYHRSGKYVLYWNGKNQLDQPVSSGMYFLKLHGKSVNKTKKIMLLR